MSKFDEVALQFWGDDDSRSPEQKLKDRRWAMVLRGPLAHLVFALETVSLHTTKAKKGLRKPGPSFVEGEAFNEILALSRTAGNLVKDILLPTSRTIANGSLTRLVEYCSKIPFLVSELVQRVGDARIHDQPSVSQQMIWNEISEHLELGKKGLLVEPKVVLAIVESEVLEPSILPEPNTTEGTEVVESTASTTEDLDVTASEEKIAQTRYVGAVVEKDQTSFGRVDDTASEGSSSSSGDVETWDDEKGEIQLREAPTQWPSVENGDVNEDEQQLEEVPVLGFD